MIEKFCCPHCDKPSMTPVAYSATLSINKVLPDVKHFVTDNNEVIHKKDMTFIGDTQRCESCGYERIQVEDFPKEQYLYEIEIGRTVQLTEIHQVVAHSIEEAEELLLEHFEDGSTLKKREDTTLPLDKSYSVRNVNFVKRLKPNENVYFVTNKEAVIRYATYRIISNSEDNAEDDAQAVGHLTGTEHIATDYLEPIKTSLNIIEHKNLLV